jgi:hypothetical protein
MIYRYSSSLAKIGGVLLVIACVYTLPGVVRGADNTDPVTSHSLSGTLGNNSWYRSNINVTLDVTDAESGPDTTTYWVDSGTPTVVDHPNQALTQFQNFSFESGSFSNINNWYKGLGGLSVYYRSNTSPKEGNFTSAIAFIGYSGSFFHWYNEPNATALPVGENVEVSAWVRAVTGSGDQSYFEVWGQNSSGGGDQLLATSTAVLGFNWSWQKVTAQFTVPSGINYVYIKAGSTASPAGIVYWDFAETRSVGSGAAQVQFTYSQEGTHTLHYFSRDNAANVENSKTTTLKKDTVAPNPWQNFSNAKAGCNHCYDTSTEIRDTTSGVAVGTAEYRFYTEHNSQFWSAWQATSQVLRAGTGSAASNGELNFVELVTPEIDFGDSSTGPFRVQYRIYDMAGNLALSPVYEIASPWVKTLDGSIYVGGQISLPLAPSGEFHSNADVMSNQDILSFTTSANWVDENYDHAQYTAMAIEEYLPAYPQIKSKGAALPSGRLPTTDGIYIVNGDYTVGSSQVAGGYENADVSAVVVITGDLTISNNFSVIENNNIFFVVEGDLNVDQNVEEMAGFYLVAGQFDSDTSGRSTRSLTVDGSVVALGGYILPRDLGANGSENNLNTPAEMFVWQADMLVDKALAGYLNNESIKYTWQEIEQP